MSVFQGLSSGNTWHPSRLGLVWLPLVEAFDPPPVDVPSEPALPPVPDVVVSLEPELVWLLEPPAPALVLPLPLPLLLLVLLLLFSSESGSAGSVSSDPQPIPMKADSRHTKATRIRATMRSSSETSKALCSLPVSVLPGACAARCVFRAY